MRLQCPYCHSDKTSVKDTRHLEGKIVRIRLCQSCKAQFKTTEITVSNHIRPWWDEVEEEKEI